jgi:demethylmenaquinone methyltransferase/2-methoxy-6-polyprenyl-1,4-benzoquinol methylase
MTDSFFVPGEQRAAKVNELFTAIARRYDLLNDFQSLGLHRYWKRRAVNLANAQAGTRALDICCGTGDLALALAHRGAQTIGLDFNEQMLQIAETRKLKAQSLRSKGSPLSASHSPIHTDPGILPHLTFMQGDAQALPFTDNSFDAVTVAYGLRNLANWETGLREMQRVAKPGGRLVVLDFAKPENPVWRRVYFGYLKLFVPLLGRWFCGNARAYSYILESLKNFPGQRAVAMKMQEVGLANVRLINLVGGAMAINYGQKKTSEVTR